MKELIDKMLLLLPQMTKYEADLIENILKWSSDEKVAFMMAKRIFEENEFCFSCGLKHHQVECRGIWYCPNALCMGSGGAWFRHRLDSYKEITQGLNGGHFVDEEEWLKKGIKENNERGIDRKEFIRVRKLEDA